MTKVSAVRILVSNFDVQLTMPVEIPRKLRDILGPIPCGQETWIWDVYNQLDKVVRI